MNTNQILVWAKMILDWAAIVREGIVEVRELVEWGNRKLDQMISEDRNPTDDEWAELNKKTAQLRMKLHSDKK